MSDTNPSPSESTSSITRRLYPRSVRRWIQVGSINPRVVVAVIDYSAASIAIAAPSGTPPPATGELLDDVKMAEDATPPATAASDISMETALAAPNGSNKRSREPTPVASDPASAPPPTPSAHESSVHEDDGSIPPPAKRPRTFSENDMMVRVFTLVRRSWRANPACSPGCLRLSF